DFTTVKPGEKVVEFGSGSGVIPLLLAFKKKPANITGLAIQEELVKLARRNIKLNNLEDEIEVISGDFSRASKYFEAGSIDLVVSNPPYMPPGSGKVTLAREKAIARHEIYAGLEDLIREAAIILKNGGRLSIVHRSVRLAEIIALMKAHRLEPKRLKIVQSRTYMGAKTVLLEARKGSRPGLEVEPVLIVYEGSSGEYTREVKKIYGEDCFD
ncbi:MAG TPA: tRNA1(Val) (adenine(37)-N6)-methyltransferase, partial [Halanaerobiales bacterium]|nr:tRNA1(Val) (adenine(37)-N6)-methyltransferase [Halanaerobiales bacterium]